MADYENPDYEFFLNISQLSGNGASGDLELKWNYCISDHKKVNLQQNRV